MRRIPLLAAVATVAAATLAAPAAASPSEFVLRGNRSAWVDVEVGLDGLDLRGIEVRTKGRFAGVYGEQIESMDPHAVGRSWGLLHVGEFPGQGAPRRLTLGRYADGFQPGVVRLYLIADGPTTVTVDTGTPSRFAAKPPKPVHPVRAAVATTTLKRSGGAWTGRTSITTAERSVTLAALVADGTLPAAADAEICVTSGPACPDDGPLGPSSTGGDNGGLDAVGPRWGWSLGYGAGELGRGRHTARFAVEHAAEIRAARALAFTLALA